ncbi:hypothetical protein V6N13_024680 [Hibiscus sabdariffa]
MMNSERGHRHLAYDYSCGACGHSVEDALHLSGMDSLEMPQLENCFLNFRGSESTLQCCLRMKEDTSHALNSVQMMQSGRCARPMVHVVWEQPKLGWVKVNVDAS